MPKEKALIGFSGAPFTLATYLVEGGPSRNYATTKAMMYGQPDLWHGLMNRLSDMIIAYLLAQASAGAQALQVFDSWIGWLSRRDYVEYVFPYTGRILKRRQGRRRSGDPLRDRSERTQRPSSRASGVDVVGLDWRVPLDEAWESLGDVAVQGNLDPAVLLAPPDVVREQTRDVLKRAGGRPGHIFNLGHGFLPQTPLDNIMHMIDCVREWDASRAS